MSSHKNRERRRHAEATLGKFEGRLAYLLQEKESVELGLGSFISGNGHTRYYKLNPSGGTLSYLKSLNADILQARSEIAELKEILRQKGKTIIYGTKILCESKGGCI
ncbi:MAG TPA: hypothetical protein VN456_06545 [Desulfosporosinus sp.]|nr:hypothetical protein [Desulfosporosinus sp.]